MRGRKPKSLRLHLADGTYRPDRHGPIPAAGTAAAPALFPELNPEAPKPPRNLQGAALTVWHATVKLLAGLGTLDEADQGILALYCEARAELGWAMNCLRREGRIVSTAAGGKKPHPAMAIKNQAALRCAKFASELGLTPTARMRMRLGAGFGPEEPGDGDSDLD